MKLSKHILEAVNRGIRLALDDYQDIEPNSSISSTNNVIDPEDVIKCKLIIHKFIPSIIKMRDKAFYECISYEDYFKFVDAANRLNKKIKLSMPVDIGDYDFKRIIQHIIFGLVDKYSHIDLNWVDTSGVKNMSYLLANFPGVVDVSEWDVSNVKNMEGIFAGSYFNGNLANWDVSNVNNMMATFEKSKFNNDSIKNWNVSNVNDMQYQDLNNWNWNIQEKCKVTLMFSQSKMELKNIPNWLKKRIKKQTISGLK